MMPNRRVADRRCLLTPSGSSEVIAKRLCALRSCLHSSIVVSRETRLFAEEVEDDLAVVGAGAVLEEVDALPGAEGGAAGEDRD
jgi:hypothetical protein